MIFAPGNFKNDPEGYLGNQAGHWAIGIVATMAAFPLFGLLAFIVVGVFYGVVWEGIVQRWALPMD
ncbi:MAG: hypothetical protein WBB85_16140, partial [Albidovulum sp.]|uniref:hypothetical protein n=1 Tax=Albidovulum sp. TaxID=1872424 RepID=UPI003CC18D41